MEHAKLQTAEHRPRLGRVADVVGRGREIPLSRAKYYALVKRGALPKPGRVDGCALIDIDATLSALQGLMQ